MRTTKKTSNARQEQYEPCQNTAISVLFGKCSFEVRSVRLHSPLPKIIENIGVLVAGKSNSVFLD